MKISIGLRLFAAVLLAMVAVAAGALALMRQNVLSSFSDYAANIELDRLDTLEQALLERRARAGSWDFLPAGDAARRQFLARELARLQAARAAGQPAPVAPPAPVAAPAPPAPPAPVAPLAASPRVDAPTSAALPPLPLPPAPPAPPAHPAPPAAPAGGADAPDALGLAERITLLDADGHYLAGRRPGSEARGRRALQANGQLAGYLEVARVQRPSDALAAAFLDQLGRSLVPILGICVALSALAATLLAAHFRQPIRQLARGAEALAEGRFDTRLTVRRSDELGDLAGHFNQLAARLGALEQSRRQWVADTSHELRTPLAVLRAQVEALQDGVRQPDHATLAAMHAQVLALNQLIDQLYTLARADVGALELERRPLDPWALAREAADAAADRLLAAGLRLEIGPGPQTATVLGDAARLRQVFANLLENAVRYTAAGGRVAVHGSVDGEALVIVVEDSAPGVPAAALPRLAERFFRVDPSRSRTHGGAGLGLALCQRIVQAHGGALGFAPSPLGGLAVTLTLPLEAA